jgi:O-antigen/teichoic acid export membrane protein
MNSSSEREETRSSIFGRTIALFRSHNAKLLTRSSVLTLIIQGLGQAAALGLALLLARILSLEEYGAYMYALACLNVSVLVARRGLDVGMVRIVSECRSTKAWGLARDAVRYALERIGATSGAVVLLWGLAAWFFSSEIAPVFHPLLAPTLVAVPFLALLALARGILRGLLQGSKAQLPELLLKPSLQLALLVILGELLAVSLEAATAMWLHAVSLIACCSLAWLWVWKGLEDGPSAVADASRRREWASLGWALLLISGMNVLLQQTDTLMVGALNGPSEAGIYNTSARLSRLMLFGLGATANLAAPLLAAAGRAGDTQGAHRLLRLAQLGNLAFAAPVGIGLLVGASWLLGLFGEGFVAGTTALSVLVGAQFVNAMVGPVGQYLSMTGRQKVVAKTLAAAAVLNLGLNAVLIPRWGINGAAVATAVTVVTWNVILAVYVRRDFRSRSASHDADSG